MATTFKHLTLEERMTILIEIKKNTQLKEIALKIHKDPTTISKEVKLHRICKKYNLSSFVTCGYNCKYYQNCNIKNLCGQNKCNFLCKACKNINCNKKCEKFEPYECKRLKRFPYVCNGCDKSQGCKRSERYYYDSSIANKEYKEILVESRNGIDTDTQSFKVLDSIISGGVKKGKSIYSILQNHPEINKSERTIYRYVGQRILSIKDIDLRNKVKMKPRKSYKTKAKKEILKEIRQNRTYKDYIEYIASNPSVHGAQLDLVFGKQGEAKCIMTVIFPFSNFMFGVLLPNKEANTIVWGINQIEAKIGTDNFKRLFPYFLTDRGTEFYNAKEIETSFLTGEIITKVFYCDAYNSSQKAQIERNHEFIRYFFQKGESIDNLTQKMVDLMFSHINSYSREAKNNHSPYDISLLLFGKELLDNLNIKKIEYDDIILNKSIFK